MASQWLKNLGHKASHVKMLHPLYDAQLGRLGTELNFTSFPPDLIGGDAGYGRWIASGQLDVYGTRIPIDTTSWLIGTEFQDTPYFTKLHSFDFLIDLKSLGGDTGRRTARTIVEAWMNDFAKYHHVTWAPNLTAHRLVNWLQAYPFAFETAADDFQADLNNALYKQLHHLCHTLDHDPDISVFDRFDILWALVITTNHAPDLMPDKKESWLQLLRGAVEDISHNDGGLITGNLDCWLTFAKQLFVLKHSLSHSQNKPPVWLDKRLETILRNLNILSHGNKSFPACQGTISAPNTSLEKLTRLHNMRIRRTDTVMEKSGYSVMRKAKTTVIINHALAPHVAPGAFELSQGIHPIIVNCGTHIKDTTWATSLTGINAHSALSIGESEPEIDNAVQATMESMNGASLWCGIFEGYRPAHRLTHTRRLYLDEDGDDFRGEDLLVRSVAIQTVDAIARFHLHPNIKASLIKAGTAVLIRTPAGSGWVFEASNADIALEPSIYLGEDGMTIRKTHQIVLNTSVPDLSHHIKWALKRQ